MCLYVNFRLTCSYLTGIHVDDLYLQHSLEVFRGYAQLCTKTVKHKHGGKRRQHHEQHHGIPIGYELIQEIPMELPKVHPEYKLIELKQLM